MFFFLCAVNSSPIIGKFEKALHKECTPSSLIGFFAKDNDIKVLFDLIP